MLRSPIATPLIGFTRWLETPLKGPEEGFCGLLFRAFSLPGGMLGDVFRRYGGVLLVVVPVVGFVVGRLPVLFVVWGSSAGTIAV